MIEFGSGIFGRIFSEARPIDWLIVVIDVIVLLWIAASDVIGVPQRWRKRRGMKRVLVLLADGVDLQSARPTAEASQTEAKAWVESVKSWIVAVHGFLAEDAVRALAVFGHWPIGPPIGTEVHPLAGGWCSELDSRLSALRSIIEKPEAFF